MVAISVVIITTNEADSIARCIERALLITDDVVVIDNGSMDGTPEIARRHGGRVYTRNWYGYGANKNLGNALARHDWILSLDADEIPDRELIRSLRRLELREPDTVYDIRFKSYLGDKLVRFGNWGYEHHIRLFNRRLISWSETRVHETLLLPQSARKKRITGYIHHYSAKDLTEYRGKAALYARLSSEQHRGYSRRLSLIKRLFSPGFGFFRDYILRLGFLNGIDGLNLALIRYRYTWLKYHLENRENNESDTHQQLVNEQLDIEC